MEQQNTFNELKFRQKIHEYIKDETERIDESNLYIILTEFDLDQPPPSIRKIIHYFNLFPKRNANKSIIHVEEKEENDDQNPVQQKPNQDQNAGEETISIDEAVSYAEMLHKTIPFQVWKKTAKLLQLQNQAFRLSKKKYFPLKDPGHNAKVNIIVGDELQTYKSQAHLKIQKKAIQKSNIIFHKNEDFWVTIKIITQNAAESKSFGQLWKGMYELITTLAQEVPGGGEFIKQFEVTTEQQQKHLLIKVKCHNPEINFLANTIVQFFDKIFKTEIKLLLEVFFDFNFDFQKLVTDNTSSIYDILTKNIRIRLKYKSSEFMTALKQLLVATNSFEGLSYVSDDPQTLALIAFVSSHECDINIRFKNPSYDQPEQQTLKQLLEMMMKFRGMIQQIGNSYPQFKSMMLNAMKNKIQVQAQVFSLFINADLYLQGLDHLLLDQSPLMQSSQNDDDDD